MNRIAAVVAGLSLAFLGTSATFAATINVPGDYALIQDAIDAAADGDTIQIAPGTYIEKILKNDGKSLTIVGTRDADGSLVTTIEAQGTCAGSNCGGGSWGDHIFDLDTPDGLVVIKDLVLTEGYASYGGAVHFKGGSLTIEGCDLINNVSRTNGVIARVNAPSESGQLLINNCTFNNNTSGSSQDYATEAYYQVDQHPIDVTMRDLTLSNGAGMGRIDTAGAILIERCAVSGADPYDSPDESGDPILESWNASSVTITDSSFEDNINGGAIYLRNCGPVAISDSTIRFNTQVYEWWNGPGVGGGIALWNCGTATISNCTISENHGGQGGGVYVKGGEGPLSIEYCTIQRNAAVNGRGGGLYVIGGGTCQVLSSKLIENSSYWTPHSDCIGDPGHPACMSYDTGGGNISLVGSKWDGGNGSVALADTVVCGGFPTNIEGDYDHSDSVVTATCLGACCVSEGCILTLSIDCDAVGGDWWGHASQCTDYYCDDPSWYGACCVSSGCVANSSEDCTALGGTWLGEGGSCDDCAPTCQGDVNADGVVDIFDLLKVIDDWGTCP